MRAFNPDLAQAEIKAKDARLVELLKIPEVKEALEIVDRLAMLEEHAMQHGFVIDGKNIHLK